MIKLLIKIVAVSSVFCISTYISAKNVETKVLNIDRVLTTANYSRQQYKLLQENLEYKKLISQIIDLEKELNILDSQVKIKSLTWTEEQKKAYFNEGEKKLTQLKNFRQQQAQATNQVTSRIKQVTLPKIEKIINDIIDEQELDILLNSNAVYFFSENVDVTAEVLSRLNDLQPLQK